MEFDVSTETITTVNSTVLTISSKGSLALPSGTTAERPVTPPPSIRWNTTLTQLEYYNGTVWVSMPGGSGTVTSVALSMPGIFTVSGSPVTTSGTLSASLNTQANNTVFAGPPSSGPAVPTFRTISMVQNDLSDVLLSSPISGQFLTYNGTKWVNSTTTSGSYAVNITPNTLVSGNKYYADVTHNLGSNNLTVTIWDVATNAYVLPDSCVQLSTNTLRVTVVGNTRTYRVVVLLNGTSIAAGGSTPSSVIVQNNGVALPGTYTAINLAPGLTATNSGSGVATITRSDPIRTLTFFATSLDSPTSGDWTVSTVAPAIADPTNSAISARQFSNTTEQGVGMLLPVPNNSTNVTFRYRGRLQTSVVSNGTLQMRLYVRSLGSNAATGAWSAAFNMTPVAAQNTTVWQYYTYTTSLASLSMTANGLFQIEMTRNNGVVGNPPANWLLAELSVEFT